MEVVAQFKYLGRPLDQIDDDFLAVQRNDKQEQKVWGILVKIM